MKIFTQSLRFKVILLVVTVELLIFSGLGVFYTQRFSQQIDNAIIARLSIPGLLMSRGELNFDAVSDKRTMEGLLREPFSEGLVIGLDGHVYFSSDPALLDTHLDAIDGLRFPRPESANVSVDAPDLITPFQDSSGTYLTCLSPLRPNGKLTGYLYLKVGTEVSEVEKRKIAVLFAIGSLGTIALTAAILTLALHWMVIRRLNVLIDIFRRFARGDYAIRAQPLRGNDEIETLMNGFNGLAERLEDNMANLSESESRFRVLVEHAPEAIVVYDVDTKLYVDGNHNAERLFGCSLERLRLSSPTDFFAPRLPDQVTVEQSVARALTGEEVVIERAITNARGQQLLCEVRLVHLPASNRRLIRASYIDITERKRAEEVLRENKHFLETVLENIPNMLFVKDAKTLNFLRFNAAGEELLGYSRDELLGKTDHDFFPKEQADFFVSKDREIINSGDLKDIPEELIDTRYLGQRILHTRKIPIFADDGSPLYLLGISEDITERKRIELLEGTLFKITDAINTTANIDELYSSIHDTLGDVIDATNFYIALYDKVTSSISFPYFADEMDVEYAYIRDFTSKNSLTGEVILSQAPVFLSEGMLLERAEKNQILGTVPKIWLGVPLTIKTEVIGVMAVQSYSDAEHFENTDLAILNTVASQIAIVIDRKQAEEEIRTLNRELEQRVRDRTARLEAANKELEAFAYTVSHDLRAPLRHIDGFIERLQKKAGTELDEQSHHFMDTISKAAKKMGQLIDDLLAFSRMGRNDMLFQPVSLEPLVRKVIDELELDANSRNIEWRIGDLPEVSGDGAMLRQVLVNLISNAMKYTRPRQQAEIEIGSLSGQEAETVIFVRDNGVGFDMTYVDKLFGVFQRLHRADEFEGTGIGLANVHRIIARHGGRTWAEGKIDQGATFYFSLPSPIQEQ